MGVVSPIGNDVNTFWNNLVNGVCGIDYIEEFPTENLPVKIAGKIKNFHPEEYGMDKPFIRKQDLFTQFGVAAAYQAMQQAGLVTEGEGKNIDPFRLGVYVGSGIGGFEIQYRETAKMIDDPSGQWVSPLFIPTMISNIAAGHIATKHHAEGPCIDVVTACAISVRHSGLSATVMLTPSSQEAVRMRQFLSESPVLPMQRHFPVLKTLNTHLFRSTATAEVS